MPSPFPGVDPFIEGQRWPSFRAQLCSETARRLTPSLGERYIALVEERMVVDLLDDISIATRVIRPDVSVVGERASGTGATTVLQPPLRLATIMESETPIHFVEVREVASMVVVTVIEILSPSNKAGEGRADYLRKRRSILNSDVNLVEIDLLRGGSRVPMRGELPNSPYFVLVHRTSQRPVADVWPIELRERLPVIPIPLLAPDKDAELDLQVVFSGAFDSVDYGSAIDYGSPVVPALSNEDAAWVHDLISTSA